MLVNMLFSFFGFVDFVFWMWIKKSLTYLGLHFRGAYETFTATMVKEWERSPNMVHSHRVTGKGHIFSIHIMAGGLQDIQ